MMGGLQVLADNSALSACLSCGRFSTEVFLCVYDFARFTTNADISIQNNSFALPLCAST